MSDCEHKQMFTLAAFPHLIWFQKEHGRKISIVFDSCSSNARVGLYYNVFTV